MGQHDDTVVSFLTVDNDFLLFVFRFFGVLRTRSFSFKSFFYSVEI